jgi:thioredoxin 1
LANSKGLAVKASSTSRWPAAAAIGLLLAAAAFAFCASAPNCELGNCLRVNQSTSTVGDTNMPLTNAQTRIQHASEANFRDLVLNSSAPVLVDFYADWCGPCQRLAPLLEQLAAETSDVRIVKVNVDENPRLAADYRINSIPNLKVFKNGKVTDEMVGLASRRQLQAMLAQ